MSKITPNKGERKSRRTHKNSRDGCPNCRRKRIKCTEELPSCQNCVKRLDRCGYLDFPAERLQHIAHKNSLKHASESPYSSSQKSSDAIKNESSDSLPKRQRKPRATVKMRQHTEQQPYQQPREHMAQMRLYVYSNSFVDVSHDVDVILDVVPDFRPWDDIPRPGESDLLGWNDLFFHPTKSERDSSPTSSTGLISGGYGTGNGTPAILTFTNIRPGSPASSVTTLSPTLNPQFSRASKIALPNARVKNTLFKVQPMPAALKNKILERTLEKCRAGSFKLNQVINDQLDVVYRPVWDSVSQHAFWLLVFHQLEVLSLYFTFFIDKLVNILIRASDAVVQGDIELCNLPSTKLSSDASSPGSGQVLLQSLRYNPGSFFYNQNDLNKLIRKLYLTYGRLMRELRESINAYHPEYPAKMSLFAAWGCFMNVSSDFKTLCLMVQGTGLLVKKLLMELRQLSDVSLALRKEMMMVNALALAAFEPDYTFDVILDLAASFSTYTTVVYELIHNYETGAVRYESLLCKVLEDPLFRHDLHEFSKFLAKLQDVYYPLIRDINHYFHNHDNNMHYVSPSLLYNMMYEWFKVYPGQKSSMGAGLNPIKKALYLFYHALGMCLLQVFTPIKSVMLVDACNVVAARIGFPTSGAAFSPQPEYAAINPISMGLVKTIKFFEYRLMLYGYYLARLSVMDQQFIAPVQAAAPEHWEYRDVVQLAPPKLHVDETQLSSLAHSTLTAANLPLFPEMRNDATCARLIAEEIQRQYMAMQNEPWVFDYATGMLNHDFHPQAVVEYFVAAQENVVKAGPGPTLETLRARSDEFLQSRAVVNNAYTA